MEYMVDLSINEQSVHWCGHSQHSMSQPFLGFQDYLLAQNQTYTKYIISMTTDIPQPARSHTLTHLYQHDLQFLTRL